MSKGFKKIPFEWRGALLALPNADLKVWMAHYLRSDKEDKVEISNSQLMRECDLGLSTIKIAKKRLKDNGGLRVDNAAYKDELGRWVSPELTATLPGVNSNPDEDSQGSNPTYRPGLENNPPSRVEKAAAGKSTLPVDTLSSVDTGWSDADASSIDTEEEAVEEEHSASAASISNNEDETGETEDIYSDPNFDWEEDFKQHVITEYLIPVAKSYRLNGNCREEATELHGILKAAGISETHLLPMLEYYRSITDDFVGSRIASWGGLKKMIAKGPEGAMISQFRQAEQLARKLNPDKIQDLQSTCHGTAAYGAGIAKVIADKKNKGKK
jgi:hypothetical protein